MKEGDIVIDREEYKKVKELTVKIMTVYNDLFHWDYTMDEWFDWCVDVYTDIINRDIDFMIENMIDLCEDMEDKEEIMELVNDLKKLKLGIDNENEMCYYESVIEN